MVQLDGILDCKSWPISKKSEKKGIQRQNLNYIDWLEKMRGVYLLELIDKREDVHVYIYKIIRNISARTLYGGWTRLTSKICSNGSFA